MTDVNTPRFSVSCADEATQTGCRVNAGAPCTEVVTVTLTGSKEHNEAGLKNRLARIFTYRSFKAFRGTSTDVTELAFALQCPSMEKTPYRWLRVPVSPYEGTKDPLLQGFLWQLKRFIVHPLPETSEQLPGCPDVCVLRKTNAYIAADQRDHVALSKNSRRRLALPTLGTDEPNNVTRFAAHDSEYAHTVSQPAAAAATRSRLDAALDAAEAEQARRIAQDRQHMAATRLLHQRQQR